MANVGVTSAQDGVLTQHPVVVPEMSSFEDVRQAIANVFATFQQSLHSQFPLTNFQGKRITNVAPPTSADDVVTLKYLQSNQPSQAQKTINPFQANSGSGGSNLWTQAGAALYPTATFTTFVLVGANNTDLSIGAGTVVTNAGTGSGFVVITAQTNASVFQFTIFGGLCSILTNKTGTGVSLPINFAIGGTETNRITTGGVQLFGLTSTDLSVGLGTVVTSSVSGSGFIVVSAATNASIFDITVFGGLCSLISSKTGTGTALPINFSIGGTEVARFTTAGNLLVGMTSSDQPGSGSFVGAGQNIFATDSIGIATASTNAHTLYLSSNPNEVALVADHTGTGTNLPMSFFINGATRCFTITSSGGVMIGGAFSTDLSVGVGTFVQNSGSGSGFIVISAATNASIFQMTIFGGLCSLLTNKTGTGTTLSMNFALGGTEVGRWDATSLALFIGLTSTDVAPTKGMIVATNDYFLVSATSNASTFQMHTGSGVFEFISGSTGSGSIVPVRFVMSGTEIARFNTTGELLIGLTSSDAANNLGNLYISNFFGILSATTNAHALFLSINGTTETVIHSSFSGTGTALPMSFYINGTRWWTVDTTGTLIGGGLTRGSYGILTGRVLTLGDFIQTTGFTANESFIRMEIVSGATGTIEAGGIGTGTIIPLAFNVGVGTEAGRFATTLAFLVGLTSSDFFTGSQPGTIMGTNATGVITAATNASLLYFHIESGTKGRITSTVSGTGTLLPIAIQFTGTETARFNTTGEFLVGLTSSDAFNTTGQIIASANVGVVTAATNASFIYFSYSAGNFVSINTGHSGTGTTLPITIRSFGTEQARWTTAGVALFGLTSTDLSVTLGTIVTNTTNSAGFIVVSAPTNASVFQMTVFNSLCSLNSTKTGTGTTVPITFSVSPTEVMRLLSTPRVLINRTTDDGSGAVLQVAGNISVNGTVLTVP